MSTTVEIGKSGEDLAIEFLAKKGYELVQRNFRWGKGEIDLIVKKGNWLIFVEVRSRSSVDYGLPEQTISAAKVKLLKKTADAYLFKMPHDGPLRFDIVSIVFKQPIDIQHFEDAFF